MKQNQSVVSDMVQQENTEIMNSQLEETRISLACGHLRTVEKLLVNPNPQAIEGARFVLQQVFSSAQGWSVADTSGEEIKQFQALCERVKKLLEGALRAQWTYIHRISSTTATYTAGPSTKAWSPRTGTLNLEA